MKHIYSFDIERKIKISKPVIKKTPTGNLESVEDSFREIKNKVVFAKPSASLIEEGEFFYGQKYNEYINAGFFTKAMLNKKMGDIGGMVSKFSIETLQKAIVENIEASRTIEFYDAAKDLNEEQQEKLKNAKLVFASTQAQIVEYEQSLRSQFSQTADVKAEQKLLEWLVFNLSYYEDEIDGNKQLFPIFIGNNYDERKSFYLELCENPEDIEEPSVLKVKNIFDQSFETLFRVASIWYNKIGKNQEEIEKALNDIFKDEKETEERSNIIEDAFKEVIEEGVKETSIEENIEAVTQDIETATSDAKE
jgi:hypothetical protein